MAPVGKENQQVPLPFPKTLDKPSWKENTLLAAGTSSSSKIPVLSKSRHPPEWRQSQPQTCSFKARTYEMSHSNPVLELAVGLAPKTPTREPFSEMQLTTPGCRNEGDVSYGKEVNTAEFVSDPEALASILSNTGLSHQMVSAAHKPSLAQRVPLKGERARFTSIGKAYPSLDTEAPTVNPFRMSHISTSASTDIDRPQSLSLALDTQQLKTLSTTLKNWKPGVQMAKANQPTKTAKGDNSTSSLEAKHPSNVAGGSLSTQSSSAGRKKNTGTSGEEEEFMPDPAAKASILLNIGLSHSGLGAMGKMSLAQRVPLKDARKLSVLCDNMQGEGPSLSQPRTSVMSAGKYGRVLCRTTPGPKGLASGAQQTNTPLKRCSNAECTPYGLARRVPITSSQSLRCSSWIRQRTPLSSRTTDKRVKLLDRVTGPMGAVGSKEEDASVPWEKIAVRLFDEEMAASVKKVPTVPAITKEMEKLQRVEYLAQLLQQEMDGDIDYEEAPSLKKLHKCLTVHGSPTLAAFKPELSPTPPQDPKPSLSEEAPDLTVTVTSAPTSTHTTSSQLHVCPSPSLQEASCPSFSATSTDLAKQRLDHLRTAPLRFHEACLNDECAFYTSRLASLTRPSAHRCQEPVAKMLNAHDTMHFTPISATAPLSPP
ncbi:tastin isoform X1 [Crotalus tigris]|uniref:tastin isoform X1 n=1 Tax=Crotalus tigris TaxID=88082 RepID=UPI00192FA0FB|nr:tastin isoform X1 [Crotalus tigris]XP_039188779.1 tastin isoform X1 [Crotalus tigris]XP_039188780.1 tastin isoform X1 [Crotalus tigris]